MTRPTRKRILLIVLAVLVAAAVVAGFLPESQPVQTAAVRRGPLQVIVEEEGETRVENRYVIAAPVPAFVRRIEWKVGDPVARDQPLVWLEPPRPAILDPRERDEAAARVDAARAALHQAEEQVQAAEATARRAVTERERFERLRKVGSATQQTLEQAVAEAGQATANLDAARAGVTAARAELTGAQAALRAATDTKPLPVKEVLRAPAAGRVLAIHRESEGQVQAAEPLLEIGDTKGLEVRVDVLSQDAVRIRPGTRVLLDQWGGETPLDAVVRRIQPQGFTKVSSLGVEEQRVNVVAGITAPPQVWAARLGSGYRVLARFIVWEDPNVLQVPSSALFRVGDGWAVFVVEDGKAVRKQVTIGQQAGLAAQVLEGLAEGDQVIVHPANEIEEGIKVEPRAE